MKLVRHEKNSLRISLSPKDLDLLEVRPEEFDYDLPKGRKIIRELFEKAKQEVDFDVGHDKVYIQLYPKQDGGCELFIIKLEEEAECFCFSSFDAFCNARKLFSQDQNFTCYRIKSQDLFLIITPALQIPPAIFEYGQKLKRMPTSLFFRAHCNKI